jgi:hypothetical protein
MDKYGKQNCEQGVCVGVSMKMRLMVEK